MCERPDLLYNRELDRTLVIKKKIVKISINNSLFAILLHNLRLENRYSYYCLCRESKDLYIWFLIIWFDFLWKKLVKSSLSICTSFCIEHPGTWIYATPGRDVTLRVYICTLVFRTPAGGYFHRHIKPEYREARGFLWYAICLDNLYILYIMRRTQIYGNSSPS